MIRFPAAPAVLGRIGGGAVGLAVAVALSPGCLDAQAPVTLRGAAVFSVVSLDTLDAVARAARIEVRLNRRIASDEPLAPVRAVPADAGALLMLGDDTLAIATVRDAEVGSGRAVEPGAARAATLTVASDWATRLRRVLRRFAADEREAVVLQGIPLFEVGGTPELRAARRADAIELRLAALAGQSGSLPPVRAVEGEPGAAVRVGDQTLVEVSAAEAEARGTSPFQLAAAWAAQTERGLGIVRREGSWGFLRRAGVIALAATAVAALLHWLLGRLGRRLRARAIAADAASAAKRGDGATPATGRAAVAGEPGLSRFTARALVRLLQLAVWWALAILLLWLVPYTRPAAYAALDRAGDGLADIGRWVATEGMIVGVIAVGAVLAARTLNGTVSSATRAYGERRGGRIALRAGTLAGVAGRGAYALVIFAALIAVFARLDIDPVPLLASAGVVGVALGFGVQTLIRDFFTGFFILLEDQYGVGDVIRVGGVAGQVERLTLRITQLRSLDGSLTSIPNGEIKQVTNLSKDYAQVVLDAPIAFGEDVDRATAVLADTVKQLAVEWPDRVLGAPEVLGVERVDTAAGAIQLRVVIRTTPDARWNVSRELRRRIIDAFTDNGIKVPARLAIPFMEGVLDVPADDTGPDAPAGGQS